MRRLDFTRIHAQGSNEIASDHRPISEARGKVHNFLKVASLTAALQTIIKRVDTLSGHCQQRKALFFLLVINDERPTSFGVGQHRKRAHAEDIGELWAVLVEQLLQVGRGGSKGGAEEHPGRSAAAAAER